MMTSVREAPHETAPADRVPAVEKFAIGLGQAAAMGTHNALTTLSNPVYNVMMGISPAYVSLLGFVQRLWDALLDPLVGQLSDNLSTRWGRRRPLIFAAALPMAIGFAALWWFPRDLGPTGLILYFLGTSLTFYFCHSFFFVPLTAMQVEATADYHERTRVASVAGVCMWSFSIFNQWLYPLLESRWFPDPITGTRWVTGGVAILYAAMAFMPALLVRERPPKTMAAGRERPKFWRSLGEAARNRDFVLLLGVRGVSKFGFSVVAVFSFYLNCYLIHDGDLKTASAIQGWLGTAYVVASVAAFWVFRLLALRVGKRSTLQISAALMVAGAIVKMIVYQPGWKWPQLIVPATNGMALAGIDLMTIAMVADVVSADELATGFRREGLYSSVLGWFDKVGNSTGALLSGFLLVWIGFDAKLGGHQSAFTLSAMKWLYAMLPFVGAAVTVILARRYSLDEEAAYDMKRRLDARAAERASAVLPNRAEQG